MPRRSAADWVGLLALVAMWGTAFAGIEVALRALPPATLVAIRVAVAAGVLTTAAVAMGHRLPGAGRTWQRFALLAAVGNAVPFFAISWGQERIPSGQAGLLMAVMPLATLVLAHFFSAGERITRRRALGFALGFAGVAVLTGPEAWARAGGGSSDIARQFAVLGGALCYAVNTILARNSPPLHPLPTSAGVMLMASALMLPAAAWLDRPWRLAPSPEALLAAGWLGVVATAAATVLYFHLIATAGPTFLSLINYLIPLVAVAAGVAALGEALEPRALGALALILAGLWISQASGQPAEPPRSA